MDRNQRSRRQKSANGSYAQQSRRSMGSRLGLEKRNAPRPIAPPEKAAPAPHAPPRQRPAQEINPQKAGYRPGTPRRTRRVTQAEIIRAKRRRRLLGALGVLAVLLFVPVVGLWGAVASLGAFVSINLLFKVTIFRVESYDRSQPVDTGIYTSDELIEALGIEKNSNLFAFSTAEKTQQLALQFPYLEHVAVEIQLPAAVIGAVRLYVPRRVDGLERLPQNSAHRRQPAGRPDSVDHVAAHRFLPRGGAEHRAKEL